MNYLAHAYLSFDNPAIQVGNMLGDFVKGKQILDFPPEIIRGIELHRKIDIFTDNHPLIIKSVALFKPHFRLSGGIFVDILFDHFLANDANHFNEESLKKFTLEIYQNLKNNQSLLTPKMLSYFGYMEKYNWLYQYKFEEGIQKSIEGLCKRYPKLGHAQAVMQHIQIHKKTLETIYHEFFPELIEYVKKY